MKNESSEDRPDRIGDVIRYGLPIVLLAVASYVLWKLLQEYSYREVVAEVRGISLRSFGLALVACAANYLVLTFYDTLAMRYIGRSMAYLRVAFASIISYAFSQTIGFPALSGGAVRYRFYSRWGLKNSEIAKVVLFSGVHFWLGLLLLAGITGFLFAGDFVEALHFSTATIYFLSGSFVATALGYLILTGTLREPVEIRNWEFSLPRLSLAVLGIGVSCLDWLFAAGCLYLLLPGQHEITFFQCLAAFLVAQIAGVVSHVPGGLGVFESVIILALSSHHTGSALVGALIVFRFVYYLVPFLFGFILFGLYELRRLVLDRVVSLPTVIFEPLRGVIVASFPPILSFLVFVAGVVLLFSGATPELEYRLQWISDIIPLVVVETSHFTNSVAGALLLILSLALARRLMSAYRLTLVCLSVGIVVSLLKGFDFEEALFLSAILILLKISRGYFRRLGDVFAGVSLTQLTLIALVIGISIWLGFFSYKHVDYSSRLWWEFAFDSDAPRFLRSSIASCSILLAFTFRMLLFRRRNFHHQLVTDELAQELLPAVRRSHFTEANLVLTGDKAILKNADSSAFIMYAECGGSWIAMGDPVGPKDEAEELVWKYRELSDAYGRYTVFYEVSLEYLPYYLDIGLSLFKLGEQAIVELDQFTLAGGAGRNFRQTVNRFEREHYSFQYEPPSKFATLEPELRAVSVQWLDSKKTKEKGFSLGKYDPEYLKHFPTVVVRHDAKIVAFANLWESEGKEELSLDLMRHLDNCPNGLMDYLFIRLMNWGKEQGYRRFNLGMAPLSGFESRKLTPLWSKIGTYLYRHGGDFYNFEGIRKYKEKFRPTWEPRYLASPGGIVLPRVLANVASLISGGVTGIASK